MYVRIEGEYYKLPGYVHLLLISSLFEGEYYKLLGCVHLLLISSLFKYLSGTISSSSTSKSWITTLHLISYMYNPLPVST